MLILFSNQQHQALKMKSKYFRENSLCNIIFLLEVLMIAGLKYFFSIHENVMFSKFWYR